MQRYVAIALTVMLSNHARPAELGIDARSQDPPPPLSVKESRVDVDPRVWYTGPEI